MAQGFSVGGEYTGASIFVAEYSPDRKRGFMGSWLDSVLLPGLCWVGRGGVNFDHCRRSELPRLGLAYSVLYCSAVRIIGLYLRHALEETPAFQQHVDKLGRATAKVCRMAEVSFKEIATKYWRSLLTCIGLVIATNVTYYMLLTICRVICRITCITPKTTGC